MLRYVLRRAIATIPVLIGISLVLFVGIRMLPGDPATAILGQHATPAAVIQVRHELGLDQPIYVQYASYVWQLLHGDLGVSYLNNKSVLSQFGTRFPATVELTLAAMIVAVGFGVPLGRIAARQPRSGIDGVVTVLSVTGVAIPVFVLGLTLQYLFGVVLPFLPTTGRLDTRLTFGIPATTHFMLLDTLLAGRPDALVDALRHLVLPALTLGSIPLAIVTRMTRAAYSDVAKEDYVRTARSKGLTESRVDSRHIMRNAWIPVITIIGLQFGSLLGGAVITETVFGWDGVGSWVVSAILNHDYFVVQSCVLIFALIFVVVNLVVDVLYGFLDPRVRDAR
ncbi:MAG TPA: ABC transporter permease [Candidatus Limnocylindrales bacterium]|nr:ABC transporter permease [Candidatus Limnocylindrales bacterium]